MHHIVNITTLKADSTQRVRLTRAHAFSHCILYYIIPCRPTRLHVHTQKRTEANCIFNVTVDTYRDRIAHKQANSPACGSSHGWKQFSFTQPTFATVNSCSATYVRYCLAVYILKAMFVNASGSLTQGITCRPEILPSTEMAFKWFWLPTSKI